MGSLMPPLKGETHSRMGCYLLSILLAVLMAGCAHAPTAPAVASPSAVISHKTETLSRQEVKALLHPGPITYHLGAGDVVAIDVYQHPDLSVPVPGVATSSGPPGAVVSNDGNLQLPLLGVVPVAGLTVAGLRQKLTRAYGRFLRHPSISVQVEEPRSIRYYLLGEFATPGLKYADRPLDLLDALALGGSINFREADLHGAYVVQGGQKLPLDFEQLLLQGDQTLNIRLRSGDTIVVPSNASMAAYVFGTVGKPGPVAFSNGRLTLLQALAEAGMDLDHIDPAKLDAVRVIRAHGARGQYFVVDARRILEGRAAPFPLESGDIVYVSPTALGSWNAAIGELLPSFQLFGAVLNPFVQIKYLRQ